MLFEILSNLAFIAAFLGALLVGAKECADKSGRTLWEELFDED